MSYRNHSNNTISSIIDYYSSNNDHDHDDDDDDDDVLRKSYSMPLPIPEFASSSAPSSPIVMNDTPSSPMMLRTSKSEENTTTTTAATITIANHHNNNAITNILPQHKLDRYGFIVNMDNHGNIIASQRDHLTTPNKNHTSRHTNNNKDDEVQSPTNITPSTGGPKSSSTYSIDTNYDRPSATAGLTTQRKTLPQSSNITDQYNTTTSVVPSSQQLTTATTTTNRPKKYYMQRRTKPLSVTEAARMTRRIMKWDTMLRLHIPNEVVMLQEQQQRPVVTSIKILQPSPLLLYNRKQRRYNTMKRRLRKGIPNQHQRSMVWPILCNVSNKMNTSPGLYHSLLLQMSHHCNNHHEHNHETITPTADTTVNTIAAAAAAVETRANTIGTATSSTTDTTNTSTTAGNNNTTSEKGVTNTTTNTSNEIEDTTKIEMNYTKTNLPSHEMNHTGTKVVVPPPPPPPIPFQYTKSFRSIQETIERDLHRTFPRHCMFYTTDVDDDEYDTNNNLEETNMMNPTNGFNTNEGHIVDDDMHGHHEEDSHPKLILGDISLDDTEDHHSSDTTRDIQQKSICGTNEIRNLIRELDLVPQMATHLMNQTQLPSTMTTTIDNQHDTNEDDHITNDNSTPTTTTTASTATVSTENDKNHSNDLKTVMNGSHNDSDGIRQSSSNKISPSSTGSTGNGHNNQSHNHSTNTHQVNILDGVGGQSRLRRVLKAYSLYDREIGYCQGMNFIAAMFLTIVTEENAFWMLVTVMHDKPCRMRGLFGEGMRETHEALYVADKLIQQFLPKLAKHFEKESIHVTMYATQWLLTQFTSSFRFDLVTRLWDSFLFEGWKTTYRVMLALLQRSQNDLLSLGFEDILAYFRELPDRPDIDGSIVDESMKIPLKTSHIRKYEIEWRSQHQH